MGGPADNGTLKTFSIKWYLLFDTMRNRGKKESSLERREILYLDNKNQRKEFGGERFEGKTLIYFVKNTNSLKVKDLKEKHSFSFFFPLFLNKKVKLTLLTPFFPFPPLSFVSQFAIKT